MKRFITKLILFFALPLVLLLVGYIIAVKKVNGYQPEKNVSICFIGDSHIQKGIDDKLVPNSKNHGLSAEQYLHSYYKIKLLLRNKQQLKKIYLGFSYHNLSSYSDEFTIGEKTAFVGSKYFFLLPKKEQFNMLKSVEENRNTLLKNLVKELVNTNLKKTKNLEFIGLYQNKFKNSTADLKSINKRICQHFYKDNKIISFSKKNIYYLKKIIEICKKNNVEIEMINSPLHPIYKSKIPKEYINFYTDFCKENKLKVLDFSDMKLSEDCYIFDGDHVSLKGSKLLTNHFIEVTRSGN
jgi:hypothetical protein